jgi:SAM-dependent methyltransferase
LSTYDLVGGTAVEIGCGRGEFLRMLRARGLRKGIGFDPGRAGKEEAADDAAISIIGDVFTPSLAPHADIVCSRHVLEHLPQPVDLLRAVRDAYASRPAQVVFTEVPNGAFMLDELGVWEPLYEHSSYFTPSSLWLALRLAGLAPARIDAVFGNQFLVAEATCPAAEAEQPAFPSPAIHSFEGFGSRFTATIQAWRDWLDRARWEGRRVALWGGGAKGVTFLNVLDRSGPRAVAQVVDVNPLKAGAFAAGTGHPIVPPPALREHRPDTVLVMNPEYEEEIRHMLDALDLDVELIVVSGRLPPSGAERRMSLRRRFGA